LNVVRELCGLTTYPAQLELTAVAASAFAAGTNIAPVASRTGARRVIDFGIAQTVPVVR
jgi:hypothetical protein